MLRRFTTVPLLIAQAAVILVAATALILAHADAIRVGGDIPTGDRMLVSVDTEQDAWPTNGRGQTFGTPTGTPYDYREPDLIKVCATNGEVGYSFRTDLEGPTPASPEEALMLQAERAGRGRVIPVYAVDGVTQIGVFVCE